jgi:hypothetical protein
MPFTRSQLAPEQRRPMIETNILALANMPTLRDKVSTALFVLFLSMPTSLDDY